MAKKEESSIDIIEEDYMVQGVTSPKELVLKHLDRISIYIFKGDTNPSKKDGKDGVVIASTDRRIITIQALDFLKAILKPYYDDTMKAYQKVSDNLIDTIENNLLISSIHSKALEKAENDIDKFKELVKFYQDKQIIPIDKDSSSYEIYTVEKYDAYIKLFEELNFLLERKNYLEGQTYGE